MARNDAAEWLTDQPVEETDVASRRRPSAMRVFDHGPGRVLLALFVSATFAIRIWPGRNGDPMAGLSTIAAVFAALLVGQFVFGRFSARSNADD